MSNIEVIIVDGVRYDRVTAKTEFVCEECELARKCGIQDNSLKIVCYNLTIYNECWKRKEE